MVHPIRPAKPWVRGTDRGDRASSPIGAMVPMLARGVLTMEAAVREGAGGVSARTDGDGEGRPLGSYAVLAPAPSPPGSAQP
jgi:hypothetical protein